MIFKKVKFNTFSTDSGKKHCALSDKDTKLSINASCKFFIEVSNISKNKLFVWIYKKINFQTFLPLERSILAPSEKLILENPKKGFKRLIFVFGEKLNNEVDEKLNNMRLYKNNIKIENQLERFSTLGYGYKVYEFFKKFL